ncbi:hypothetical protein BpHYR1_021684 [Brachionus plicatilis]|uniref:Uncharacterized protein n=1 Tax=Brachionus plicatilis TaxID=10195 RepID=A0A3M7RUR4_BRAPC|nr:hypothetical protein BpHYR1_021684 [Brachionus plicatilis]
MTKRFNAIGTCGYKFKITLLAFHGVLSKNGELRTKKILFYIGTTFKLFLFIIDEECITLNKKKVLSGFGGSRFSSNREWTKLARVGVVVIEGAPTHTVNSDL